jgi:C1A family cysteine protease
MEKAFNYLIGQNGISLLSKYQYKAVEGKCNYRKTQSGGTISSFEKSESGDEELLKAMVAKYGPICAAVDASLASFQSYKSGIYCDSKCTTEINHAIVIVGYGTDKKTKKDFWLIKNSYGEKWGEKG